MLRSFRILLVCVVVGFLGQIASAAAQPRAEVSRGTHVYLLRGLMNIFSLGLDDLAEKMTRRGISASVHNHAEYADLAGTIIARYRAGWRGPIVLVGHSLGADNVYPMAALLGAAKVPVALVVSFDPVGFQDVPGNVQRAVNYFVSGAGNPVGRGRGFRGELSNIDMAGRGDYGHMNIEKSPALHAQVIARVAGLGGGAPRAPRAAAAPVAASAGETTGSTGAPANGTSAPPAAPGPAAPASAAAPAAAAPVMPPVQGPQ